MRSGMIAIGVLSLLPASCVTIPTPEDANDAVPALRRYESWAWAAGITLIWADLVLPVPRTAVIAALGITYGTIMALAASYVPLSSCCPSRSMSCSREHGRNTSALVIVPLTVSLLAFAGARCWSSIQ